MQSLRLLTSVCQSPKSLVRSMSKSAEKLLRLPKVQIKDGEAPYLLLTVYIHGQTQYGRTIVRGWSVKEHDIIYKKVRADMEKLGLCIQSRGGGFINNDGANKAIQIYGACSTHGRADHARTREILESWSAFSGYTIKITD
ncbi:sex-regulated protein janus-B-like [Drosophila tropicalis]|uniref:sex-regulated protein janus-B-like n=1 Tax=Drosophila tropicalis TaxID=46794 RepID=UPI0035AB99A0